MLITSQKNKKKRMNIPLDIIFRIYEYVWKKRKRCYAVKFAYISISAGMVNLQQTVLLHDVIL